MKRDVVREARELLARKRGGNNGNRQPPVWSPLVNIPFNAASWCGKDHPGCGPHPYVISYLYPLLTLSVSRSLLHAPCFMPCSMLPASALYLMLSAYACMLLLRSALFLCPPCRAINSLYGGTLDALFPAS